MIKRHEQLFGIIIGLLLAVAVVVPLVYYTLEDWHNQEQQMEDMVNNDETCWQCKMSEYNDGYISYYAYTCDGIEYELTRSQWVYLDNLTECK